MPPAILERQRQVWDAKPSLRQVYRGYFERVLGLCCAQRPIVELGAGPGTFREHCPDIIATDVALSGWANLVCDAAQLPFADGSIGNLVMIDVFHHLADPAAFLAGAGRVLRPGGRVVMLEPWTSPAGYHFYRHVHHERADYRVDPIHPFDAGKDAFDGNATLPRMWFDRSFNSHRAIGDFGLTPRSVDLVPGFDWLATGGFRPYGLKSPASGGWLSRLEVALRPVRSLLALRAFITLERTDHSPTT